jgi:hypothetical protein
MLIIDIDTARRFILGKQGLWPGPRWRGLEGVEQAMAAMEYLQLDPLQIIARSQDITLHSRVLDTTPGMWEDVAYQKRKFFDGGGWLAVRPMDELPHWRVVMRRERDDASRIRNPHSTTLNVSITCSAASWQTLLPRPDHASGSSTPKIQPISPWGDEYWMTFDCTCERVHSRSARQTVATSVASTGPAQSQMAQPGSDRCFNWLGRPEPSSSTYSHTPAS